jgi:hypothetical protein
LNNPYKGNMKLNPICLGTLCLTFFVLHASYATLYVDLNSTNPFSPYADWSTAATNIQDAVDAATNGDLILVNDGFYQDGYRTTAQPGFTKLYSDTNRVVVDKPVTVQSLNGPSAAFISGGGIYRCVYLTNSATLSGFTLMSGAAGWVQSSLFAGRTITTTNVANGGAVAGNLFGVGVVSNCVLTGNTATGDGGGAYEVTLINCALTSNTAKSGGGAGASTLLNCIVTGNSAQTDGVISINRLQATRLESAAASTPVLPTTASLPVTARFKVAERGARSASKTAPLSIIPLRFMVG